MQPSPRRASLSPIRRPMRRRSLAGETRRGQGFVRGLSGARPLGLCDRRSAAAGGAARRGRGGARATCSRRREPRSRARRRRAAAAQGAALQLRRGDPSRPKSSASCRRPICRTIASSTRSAISRRAPVCGRGDRARGRARRRSARTCCSSRTTFRGSRSTSRSARTCGCPIPPSSARRHGRRERCCSISRRATSPSARRTFADCSARVAFGALPRRLSLFGGRGRGVDHRSRLGRPGRDLRELASSCSPKRRALRRRAAAGLRRHRSRTHRAPSGCASDSFGDCADAEARRERFRDRVVRLEARQRRMWASSARSRAFPSCPTDPARLSSRTCYEAYNIQVAGAGAAAARHGLKEAGDRRLRRARFDPGADGRARGDRPAGPAASEHPGLHPAGLRHLRRDQGQRLGADAGARRHRARDRHPPAARRCWTTSATRSRAASRSTTSPSRTCRPALRTDYLFRLANHHDGIVVGTGDLSELALGWCTYGVGDQMATTTSTPACRRR